MSSNKSKPRVVHVRKSESMIRSSIPIQMAYERSMNTYEVSDEHNSIAISKSSPFQGADARQKTGKISPSSITVHQISRRLTYPSEGMEKDRGSWFDILPNRFGHKRLLNRKRIDDGNPEQKQRRRAGGPIITHCCCYCLMASLLAAILLAILVAVIIMMALQKKETTSTSTSTTTSTTATTTTATTSTSTTSSTSSTTSTTTSVTSSTSSSTTSSSSTSTTTSTTTTTTTAFDSCQSLRWNQTGIIIGGTGAAGSAANQFNKVAFIYIDANDTLYVCDHHNYRVQKYPKGTTSGITIFSLPDDQSDHPEGITFDKNGYMYIAGHGAHRVLRFPPNSAVGTVIAGSSSGASGATLSLLEGPLGIDVDDDLNLYIAERVNKRVMKWTQNATSGTIVISPSVANTEFYGLLLSPYASNQVYVSSENLNAVYLWNLNSSNPLITFQTVNNTVDLDSPRGIRYDRYGNLYVADKGNKRVVMFCANSTFGRVVVGQTGTTPTLDTVLDVALDSDLNLYVSDESLHEVIKYQRL